MPLLNQSSKQNATQVQTVGGRVTTMVDDYKDRLAAAMKDAGVDTAALAQAIGVSYQAVRKALNGGKFGAENNAKAAEVLRVSSDWLATGKGPKPTSDSAAPVGRRKGDFVKAVTPDEQALLDELLELFRELFPSDRKAKLEELRAIAKVRAAERKDLFEEAGVTRIMEKAANATRRHSASIGVDPRNRVKEVHPDAPELPHIPPPLPDDAE
jgi:transcriptional regulator with XRE-family HTH domain